jgi:predicted nuclease of predicted toxin-antitoxin system
MRFKTDENLPEEFAQILRAADWDALSVLEERLGGTVDPEIARICQSEARVLITLDMGFADIRSYPPHEYVGIIVLRPAQQDKPNILAIANRIVMALNDHPIDHELWIVDDRKIRIRS